MTDEWIKKMWYIYTMEYYSAIKKNEILPTATTWMELECTMLSKISQSGKDKYHTISLICGISETKKIKQRKNERERQTGEERERDRERQRETERD